MPPSPATVAIFCAILTRQPTGADRQTGGRLWLWSLDIDIDMRRSPEPPSATRKKVWRRTATEANCLSGVADQQPDFLRGGAHHVRPNAGVSPESSASEVENLAIFRTLW
ncbi:hypothetical protein ColTof4_10201 [Colletotrichum tofieldiae]|nr:hypothetical protein ColTof3_06135 [Colletotrichum tofieldiae]GKT77778.1 hypothetical protein ColTof4_10201 [Colletotrichum tofieldiae]